MYRSLKIVVNGNRIIDPAPNFPNDAALFESGLIADLNLNFCQSIATKSPSRFLST
jgi:hypothetical protein